MNKIKEFFLGNRTPAYANRLANQFSLTCRVLVGGYVAYLGMGLRDAIKNAETATNRIVFIAALVFFTVVGALLVYCAVRDLIIGRYVGGKLDLGDEEEDIFEEPDDKIDGEIDAIETVVYEDLHEEKTEE